MQFLSIETIGYFSTAKINILFYNLSFVLVGVGVVGVVVGNQAVTRGENKLPHAHYTSDP